MRQIHFRIVRHLAAFLAILIVWTSAAQALIISNTGNSPVTEKNSMAARNWPVGATDLANLSGRVGWWEGPPFGGGRMQFEYRGDTADLNLALAKFAAINAPQLVLIVHGGAGACPFLGDSNDKSSKDDLRVDWEFAVWDPASFYQLYNGAVTFDSDDPEFRQELEPPQMDVYVVPGRIDWSKVKVPTNVTVKDERATANGYKPEDGAVIRGSMYDMLTSKPLAEGQIVLESYDEQKYKTEVSIASDANGRFEAKHIPPGFYRVVARCSGYAPRALDSVGFYGDTLKNFCARLSPTQAVSGTVVDAAGKPLSGVAVRSEEIIGLDGRGYLLPDNVSTVSGSDGRFVLDNMPVGGCRIFAWAKGLFDQTSLKTYEVPGSGVEVRMTATGILRVRVKSWHGGDGVNVHVQPRGESIGKWIGDATLNADGGYEFDNVPPDDYFVSTHYVPGEAPDSRARIATVTARHTTMVELP
jgi:hypothetical protein